MRQALGQDVRKARREASAAGVMMIPIPNGGRLQAVSGKQAAKDVPGVEEVIISIPIGEMLVPLPEGGSYLGFIFARSDERIESKRLSVRPMPNWRSTLQGLGPCELPPRL